MIGTIFSAALIDFVLSGSLLPAWSILGTPSRQLRHAVVSTRLLDPPAPRARPALSNFREAQIAVALLQCHYKTHQSQRLDIAMLLPAHRHPLQILPKSSNRSSFHQFRRAHCTIQQSRSYSHHPSPLTYQCTHPPLPPPSPVIRILLHLYRLHYGISQDLETGYKVDARSEP